MKEWKLLEALGDIDSALLSEPGRIRIRRKALAAAAVAAALVLAFGVTLLVGAVSRPELPVFYSVNGSLYRRATNAGAILLEMLPSSCHGEKVGEATPVDFFGETEAPDASAEPDATAAPHATKPPIEPAPTDGAGSFSAWSFSADGWGYIIISGGTYTKASFGDLLAAFGISEDEGIAISLGGRQAAEGEAAKEALAILGRAESADPTITVGSNADEGGDTLTVKRHYENFITGTVPLAIKNGEGRSAIINIKRDMSVFRAFGNNFFVLSEEDAAALCALLGVN